MTTAARVELGLIAITVMLVASVVPTTLAPIGIATLVLRGAALLLLQGLVRDVSILLRRNVAMARNKDTPQARSGRYFCIESAVGGLGVLIGAALLSSALDAQVHLDRPQLVLLVGVILGAGFLIRDWVIQMQPWRITRDPDHLNIIVRWRH